MKRDKARWQCNEDRTLSLSHSTSSIPCNLINKFLYLHFIFTFVSKMSFYFILILCCKFALRLIMNRSKRISRDCSHIDSVLGAPSS